MKIKGNYHIPGSKPTPRNFILNLLTRKLNLLKKYGAEKMKHQLILKNPKISIAQGKRSCGTYQLNRDEI